MYSSLVTSFFLAAVVSQRVRADDDLRIRFPHPESVVGQDIRIDVFEDDGVEEFDDRIWFSRILITPPNSDPTVIFSTTNANLDSSQTAAVQSILSDAEVNLDDWATTLPQELCTTHIDSDDDDDDDDDDRTPAFGSSYTPAETGTYEAIVEFVFWYGETGYRRPGGTSDICIDAPYQGEVSRATRQWTVLEAGSSLTYIGTPSPTEVRLSPSPTGNDFDDDNDSDDDDDNGNNQTRPPPTTTPGSSRSDGPSAQTSQTALPNNEPSSSQKETLGGVLAILALSTTTLMSLFY